MSIHILPQEIVDRIAAGEVVQRPANAIKEVLENSLDSGASSISVTMEAADSWCIVDNGKGICRDDLKLAATRHATSKLSSTSDFDTLESFGFRGEALASISMCSQLTIVSKPAEERVAYKQIYKDGAPCLESPQPCARQQGTTIRIDNLFYNVPHRQKANSSSESYNQVLSILQSYAVLVAGDGISIICQKKSRGTTKVDLNSAGAAQQINDEASSKKQKAMATKQVLQQVHGSQVIPHLCEFEAEMKDTAKDTDGNTVTESHQADSNDCQFSCQGFITSPSYGAHNKKTSFTLFCNNRLVECSPLKRAVEAVYSEYTTARPLVFWSIQVPPHQIDVNVHPTKRQVTLLYLDEISSHLQQALRACLQDQGQTFQTQSVLSQLTSAKRKREKENEETNSTQSLTQSQITPISSSLSSTATKLPPSKLIRTNRSSQQGSIEPFVRMTSSSQATQSQPLTQASPPDSSTLPQSDSSLNTKHLPECPLASSRAELPTDLNEPGAFAKVATACTCRTSVTRTQDIVRLPPQSQQVFAVQPRKIQPSSCDYKSVISLRKKISKRAADTSFVGQLRSSCLVGVLSHQRSLLQCGADLVIMNHHESACELFYQLALLQFGALVVGEFAVPIDIAVVIAQSLEVEDMIQRDEMCEDSTTLLPVSEWNETSSIQAAAFLREKAPMLMDYFSISIETDNNDRIVLSGLPVLLNGHAPSPHGLGLFLLRLATQVDYSDEKPCFHGLCWELARYYASMTAANEADWYNMVRHSLFPSISTLLLPSKLLQAQSFQTVANLSQLYKVFERC
jgi:DNA mismatch repair protein MLH1